MNIIINGRSVHFSSTQITYEELLAIAQKSGNPSVIYKGPRHGDSQRSGTMHPGCKPVALAAQWRRKP